MTHTQHKMGERLEQSLHATTAQRANQQVKESSTALVIREMQIFLSPNFLFVYFVHHIWKCPSSANIRGIIWG